VDFVGRELRELVSRTLIVEVTRKPLTYRLRFPHHLPVLLEEDPAEKMLEAIAELCGTLRTNWIYPDTFVDTVRWHVSDEARAAGSGAVVVATHWLEPMVDRGSGLGARLGVDGLRVDALPERLVTDTSTPPLCLGGASLVRSALGERGVEVCAPGRLDEPGLRWWYQRVRSVEFTAANAYERLVRATGGIPLLVRLFDNLLMERHAAGSNVDGEQLGSCLEAFRSELPRLRAELRGDAPMVALTPREYEVLQIIAKASLEWVEADDLAVYLTDPEMWDADRDGSLDVEALSASDDRHVSLLLALGLVDRLPGNEHLPPVRRIRPIRREDAVRLLLE
jgi:hypothetical protein